MSEQLNPLDPADPAGSPQRAWRRRRWLPAVLAPALVAGAALAFPAVADAAVDLPDLSAEQVLALVASSQVTHFSGTIEQSSDLGLPRLPMSVGGGTDLPGVALEMLTAPHTARVFVSGDSARLQMLDAAAERDVISDGRQAWIYDSTSNEAIHLTAPAGGTAGITPAPKVPDLTPQQFATQAIAAITPSTEVSVGRDRRVAGRAAYELRLAPKSADTLVDSVVIAVDAQTGMPLGVDVRARDHQEPAIHVGFTALDLSTPDPAVFQFTPPADAKLTERDGTAHPQPGAGTTSRAMTPPTVTGSGWDAVIEVPGGVASLAASPSGGDATGDAGPAEAVNPALLLSQVTTAVPGGRALRTRLVSALVTDDGRVLAGMVPVSRLQEVAQAR